MSAAPSPAPSPAAPLRSVLVVSPVFGASCRVLGGADGGPCVVVDPGAGVAGRVDAVVRERGWRPVAVLATHGHVDHTFDAAAIGEAYDVPLLVHSADAYRIDDPFGTIEHVSGALAAALAAGGADPATYRVPARVAPFGTPSGIVEIDPALTALGIRAVHAPGHTQGSTLYLVDALVPHGEQWAFGAAGAQEPIDESTGRPAVLTGDVLFAGTIGRTDLPGGDHAVMVATLRDVVGRLDENLLVLPGHGPSSDVAHERRTNPLLP
ncbi:MBL fold hydrolase [Paraoerskovia sediminicola]|uniref:MBL fold hydrolase n=1 Tax=Paraoerskovia sediminicola TaxID=1138587 RepID=A0ABM8G5N5_9CELL|nr:MBL fold metallo-hydrolase [Paraoerskovia sediminicola]BDZ43489.1 MBL fold hydrolase [Paraoerskovia sediminicola]